MARKIKTKKYELIMSCNTLDELLDVEYGKLGTPERKAFDEETAIFCLAETLKEERKKASRTQDKMSHY